MPNDSLSETEAFQRSVIESSTDCIKVLDLQGNLLAMLNAEKTLGIEDIGPLLNKPWLDFWKGGDRQAAQLAINAALAGGKGNFVGFFRTPSNEPKWWDVTVSPILDASGKPAQLLAVSRDVTQRRREQMNLEFLATVSRDLLSWHNVREMMQTIGAKLAAHLELSLCAFAEINETAERVVINHDWHREDVPGLVGEYRLADFVGDNFIEMARSGEVIVVSDVATDSRTDPKQFAALKITSFICMPLIREGQWRFALCLYKSEAYSWREDEIELTREMTARIWTRLERLRAEAALYTSEQRYRMLFESIDEGFCIIDKVASEAGAPLDFRYIEANKAFEVQSGIQDVIGKTIRQIFPNESEEWFVTYDAVLRTGEPIRFERELVSAGRVLELQAFRVQAEAHATVAVIFKDITARKQAEEILRQSEERYRNLFNSMDQGYCIIEVIFDAQGKAIDYLYLEVNPSFEAMSGMHAAQGKRIREMIPDLEDFWVETYGKVALTGDAVRVVNEVKPLNSWFDVYAFRFGGVESRKVACLFTNITERKKAEETLRKSEERFRALFDWGPIAMYSCDSAGIIQEYNQGAVKIWGRVPNAGDTDEQFRGSFKTYLPNGTFVPYAQSAMTRILKSEISEMHDMEVLLERADGSRITLVVNVVPLKNDERQVTGAITCFYDVTERSQLERKTLEQAAALTELDRRKDEFLAMLSHELRNPLAPISNAVRLLRLQKNEDPVQMQARTVIERQVGQLNRLVDELLEISRITTGRVQLRHDHIDISGIVERAVETTQPLIAQRRHALKVSLPPEAIWLHADAARLEQVLVNLLTNAAKYTDEGGRISLSVQLEGDSAVLRVTDNGMGIAPELLPRIFELFTQAERSLDRSQGGLGIGLCLVQRLVELHGGTIAVQSVLGSGSEFVVRLPSATAHLPPSPSLSLFVEAVPSSGNFCRVLVVDDNVDAAQSLADLLTLTGHEVRLAHEGMGAVQAAVAWCPDVVLLDIGLPGLNGFEVARRIRSEATRKTIVLVALTGYGQASDRQQSRDAGFDHHLVKPADFDEVEKILAAVARVTG